MPVAHIEGGGAGKVEGNNTLWRKPDQGTPVGRTNPACRIGRRCGQYANELHLCSTNVDKYGPCFEKVPPESVPDLPAIKQCNAKTTQLTVVKHHASAF